MKRIIDAVVPEDDLSRVAAAASELAQDTGAAVTVVSVDDVESQRFEPVPRSELVAAAERRAGEVVEQLTAAGIRATAEVRSGRAADSILEVADEVAADLIVVGSRHQAGLAERLLGGLPLELIRRSKRQVLVVAES